MRMLAAMTATPNLDWFLKELGAGLSNPLGAGEELYRHLEKVVNSVPPGSEGVILHPCLFPGGERGPFVKPTARASFTGLSFNPSSKHLRRAGCVWVACASLVCFRNLP